MLEPRDGYSATLLADGTILIVGGYREGMRRLASAERYDPASRRSPSAGPMSEPRISHTPTLIAARRARVTGCSSTGSEVLSIPTLFSTAPHAFPPPLDFT